MAPVGLFDFSGAFESFERYFFFFDYPRVDTFSFTKIGKPVSAGWILGFAYVRVLLVCGRGMFRVTSYISNNLCFMEFA